MSRVAAWKKKKSAQWFAVREELNHTTLYLVNRLGPTVFSVRDDGLSTHKVVLGNPHSCTCDRREGMDELCVHQLYCLLKVLRIDEGHPLVCQLGLTDPEAEQVLSGQCCAGAGAGAGGGAQGQASASGGGVENRSAVARARRKARQGAAAQNNSDPGSPVSNSDFVERQLIGDGGGVDGSGEEDLCPICQDCMNKDQALTWCRKGCGNNIHAKCMQTFAQYKISSQSQVECPLCRAEWNIALLKDDVRGKATLKNTCAPVYCYSCTLPVRSGPFHRCIECSQKKVRHAMSEERDMQLQQVQAQNAADASASGDLQRNHNRAATKSGGGVFTDVTQFRERAKAVAEQAVNRADSRASTAALSKRYIDFCARCFTHALPKEHAFHHFVSSDATTNADDDVEWAVALNPLKSSATSTLLYYRSQQSLGATGTSSRAASAAGQRPTSSGDYDLSAELLEMQNRELTSDDYTMLLELDNVPVASITEHLAASLPRVEAENVEREERAESVVRTPTYLLSPQRGEASIASGRMCWCRVTHKTAAGMNISSITNAKLRYLPCGHAAHDTCIRSGLDAARNSEAIPYASFRCKHEGCRSLVFPSLNRARKKKKKTETQPGDAPSGAAAASVSLSGGSVMSSSSSSSIMGSLADFEGLSVSGIGTRFGLGPVLDPQSGNFGVSHPRGFGGLVATAKGSILIPAVTPPLSRTLAPVASASSVLSLANSRIGSPAAFSDDLPDTVEGGMSFSSHLGDLSGRGLVLGSRVHGRSNSGQVLRGRTRALYDARKPEPSKPSSHTFEEVNNPANPMRGRQLFHRSPLAPLGTIKGQPRRDIAASMGFEESFSGVVSGGAGGAGGAGAGAGENLAFTASVLQGNGGSLLVRSASSARLVTTPIVHPESAGGAGGRIGVGTSGANLLASSESNRISDGGQRTTSASASASTSSSQRNALLLRTNSAANAAAGVDPPSDHLRISGGNISSHTPSGMPGLVQVLRATSGAAVSGTKRSGRNQLRMYDEAGGGHAFAASGPAAAGPARKGKLAKSALGRPPETNASGNVFTVSTHAEGQTSHRGSALGLGLGLDASLSSTQLNFRSRAKLSEHLQPSGLSRSLARLGHAAHAATEEFHQDADFLPVHGGARD